MGEPRLDGVDRARLTGRDAPAVLTAQRGVERRHERHVVEGGDRRRRPGALPVVGVDDVGPPVAELGGQADEVVVGRGGAGDDVVVGDPRQLGGGAQDADGGRRRARRSGPSHRQHDDVVAGLAERSAQPVDVGRRAAGERRVLPREHQDPHRRARYPCDFSTAFARRAYGVRQPSTRGNTCALGPRSGHSSTAVAVLGAAGTAGATTVPPGTEPAGTEPLARNRRQPAHRAARRRRPSAATPTS